MVSVKRTAYPSLKKQLNEEELTALYSLSQKEMSLICQNANGSNKGLLLLFFSRPIKYCTISQTFNQFLTN